MKYLIPPDLLNYMILLKTPNSIIIGDKEHKLKKPTTTSYCSECSIRGICDRYLHKLDKAICSKFRIPGTYIYHDTTKDAK